MVKLRHSRGLPLEIINHSDLLDMPDVAGINSDHDARYYTQAQLGSVVAPSGASLIGVADAGGFFVGADVEAVLQEIMAVILPGDYLRLDGTNVPTANYNWVTNLTTTGTIQGGTITDGTVIITGGNITGGVAATFTGNVEAASFTIGGVPTDTIYVNVTGDTMTGPLKLQDSIEIGNISAQHDAGGAVRFNFGTAADEDLYMEFGAYNGWNNIDTKNRDFRIFSNAHVPLVIINAATGLWDFDDNDLTTTGTIQAVTFTDGVATLTGGAWTGATYNGLTITTGVNTFTLTRGTTDLIVSADCTINQDLSNTSSPTFNALTVTSINGLTGIGCAANVISLTCGTTDLTVSTDCAINQNLNTGASPSFVTVTGTTSVVAATMTLATGSITDTTGTISFVNENLTTTGIGTVGKLLVYQQADDQGIQIYGHDDVVGLSLRIYITSGGHTYIRTSAARNIYLRPGGTLVGWFAFDKFGFYNDKDFNFGQSGTQHSVIRNSTAQTVNALLMGLDAHDAGASNTLIITEKENKTFNFQHPVQTNPTVFFHSAAQSTTQWLSITHDGIDGVINEGTGTIKFGAAANWTANGVGNVTITNVAPAGLALPTISKWFRVKDDAGATYYIPAWT